jgi:hypothetical protein
MHCKAICRDDINCKRTLNPNDLNVSARGQSRANDTLRYVPCGPGLLTELSGQSSFVFCDYSSKGKFLIERPLLEYRSPTLRP